MMKRLFTLLLLSAAAFGQGVRVEAINGDPNVGNGAFATIDAALASSFCTSNGCRIKLSPGSFTCPTTTITTPVVIEGSGMGGPLAGNATFVAATVLTNAAQTANCVNIGLPAGNALSGVVLRGFQIQGNKNVNGATSGDGVSIVGGNGATEIVYTLIDNVFVSNAKGNGLTIKGNVFINNIRASAFMGNAGHGIALATANSGVVSQTRIEQTTSWTNAGDGLNVSGSGVNDVNIVQSTFANNTNGVNVVAGATNAQVEITQSNLESNSNAGFLAKDGYGHAIRDSGFPSDGVQLFGVNVDPPSGAGFGQVQIYLENNNLGGSVTRDVQFSANLHVGHVGCQKTNTYSYSDLSQNAIQESCFASRQKRVSIFRAPETFAPAGLASVDYLWADSTAHRWRANNNNGGATTLALFSDNLGVFASGGTIAPGAYTSSSNCQLGGASGTSSPAACGSAPAGMIAIPASTTSYQVNTTAVTANSEIIVQQMTDNSGLPSSPTCNSGPTNPIQSTRSAGTSFTVTLTSVVSVTCLKYWIVN